MGVTREMREVCNQLQRDLRLFRPKIHLLSILLDNETDIVLFEEVAEDFKNISVNMEIEAKKARMKIGLPKKKKEK